MRSMPRYAAYRRSEERLLLAKEAAGLEINSVGKRRCKMPFLPTRTGLRLGRQTGMAAKVRREENRAGGRD